MMVVRYTTLFWIVFTLMQPLVYYVFIEYGHDTHMYMDMARGVGDEYLEFFWVYSFRLLGLLSGVNLIKLYFMYFLFVAGSYSFYSRAMLHARSNFSRIAILFLILSVQLTSVGGAFRQGICILFFCSFLIGAKGAPFLLSVLTHWSGAGYLLFLRRAKYFLPIIIFAFLVVFFVALQGEFSLDIGVVRRILFYLSDPFDTNLGSMIFILFNKFLVFFLFFINRKLLIPLVGSSWVLYLAFIFAPFLQVVLFLTTGSQQILHRVGMILDPFVMVFFIMIVCFGGKYSRIVVFSLVAVKFASRLALVLV